MLIGEIPHTALAETKKEVQIKNFIKCSNALCVVDISKHRGFQENYVTTFPPLVDVTQSQSVIFNPKIYVAKFGPLNRDI